MPRNYQRKKPFPEPIEITDDMCYVPPSKELALAALVGFLMSKLNTDVLFVEPYDLRQHRLERVHLTTQSNGGIVVHREKSG